MITGSLMGHDISLYYHPDHLSKELMQHMIRIFKVDTLVETGTYMGSTAQNASPYFSNIHTVEILNTIFLETQQRLSNYKNIAIYYDNSYNFLLYPEITSLERPLYWLDAHYCGEGTGTLYSENNWIISPLEKELQIILNHWSEKGVILIDDLRG